MKCKLILINKMKCKKCGDVIESKYTHDFKACSCGACAVDGGLEYLRRVGELEDWEDLSEFKEVEITPKYNIGDIVVFTYPFETMEHKGKIVGVDAYYNSLKLNYNIKLLNEERLFEHVDERYIVAIAS